VGEYHLTGENREFSQATIGIPPNGSSSWGASPGARPKRAKFVPEPSPQKRPGPNTLPEAFIGNAEHNRTHVAQLVRLGVIAKAPQVQFPFDALERGGLPSQRGDG
jgi:hypothetical protein